MMRIIIFSIIFLFNFFSPAAAQVKTKLFKEGIPLRLLTIGKNPPYIISAPSAFLKLLENRLKDSTEFVDRFAYSFPIKINILDLGERSVSDSITTLIFSFTAEKAINVSFEFQSFHLSEHAILSIHSTYELTDSILADQNNKNNVWATRVYQGDQVTISLKCPIAELKNNELTIDKINFGFASFGAEFFGHPGASATCNVNVACPDGSGWQNERNSIALIVSNGATSCTGALIRNFCSTSTPYLLTANHCLDIGNVNNWVFQFEYYSTNCATNVGYSESLQFNGCTLKANYAPSDFALLQLNTIPASSTGVFYSGFSHSTQFPNGSMSLHHPMGDVMKLAEDVNLSTQSSWGGVNNHWKDVFDIGTVEHGSSGAPLSNIKYLFEDIIDDMSKLPLLNL